VSRIVLAFDPGSTWSGYGVLRVEGSRACPETFFAECGEIESTGEAADVFLDAFLARWQGIEITAAVEWTRGVAFETKKGIVPSLIECAQADATLRENLRRRPMTLVRLTALTWRKHVCRNPSAPDPVVAAWLPRFVRNLPAVTNVHERDALGLAVAVAWGVVEPPPRPTKRQRAKAWEKARLAGLKP
jgi:Holliday junction resolvasome RuvABC endonuclease subunit